MSKKPNKRRGAATDSPLLPELRAILEEYRPLKQATDENDKLFDALEDLAAKQGAETADLSKGVDPIEVRSRIFDR